MSTVFFVLGMVFASWAGSGHPPWGRYPCLVKCTQSHARAERKLQAGDHMTAAVGGNPCKRLQATLAPCGQPLPDFRGGSPVDAFVQNGGCGKDKKPLPGWITSAEKGF